MFSHRSRIVCLVSVVLCAHPLRVVAVLCTVLYRVHSTPPSPTSPPSSSPDSSFLFTRCQPLYASYCTLLLYFSRYCTVRWKMFSFLCLFLMYYLCEWYCKPITVRYHIANLGTQANFIGLMNKLDLGMHFWNAVHSFV